MFTEILKDSKAVAMLITSVGGILLAAFVVYIFAVYIGGAITQGFNNIALQMQNSNKVLQDNSTALSANTQATNQMNQLLIQALGNKFNKASLINDLNGAITQNENPK